MADGPQIPPHRLLLGRPEAEGQCLRQEDGATAGPGSV